MTGFDYSLHYSQWHDETPEHRRGVVTYHVRELRPLLSGVPRGKALDIGCGMGFLLEALKEIGFEAEGLDSDSTQVAASRRAGLSVIHTGDIAGFAACNRSVFHVVTMFDLLEHIPISDQFGVLQAARSLLAPGGVLIIQTPNALSPVASYQRYVDWTHTSAFTTVSLRPLLVSAGFDSVEFRPDLPLEWSWKHPPGLRRWLVRRVWRFVVHAEIGYGRMFREMPTDINLTATARAT